MNDIFSLVDNCPNQRHYKSITVMKCYKANIDLIKTDNFLNLSVLPPLPHIAFGASACMKDI